MLDEFNRIIKEMDSKLNNYFKRRKYEKKLSHLKENHDNETDLINEITYFQFKMEN